MRMYNIINKDYWEKHKSKVICINMPKDIPEPKGFPCVAVVAYADEGWDEIGYVYLDDFEWRAGLLHDSCWTDNFKRSNK